jgi:ATP-dependent protease Clp ATPase subunit
VTAPWGEGCAFCGKARQDVHQLVRGPLACICDACVRRCDESVRASLRAATAGAELTQLAAVARQAADELSAIRDAKALGEQARQLAMRIFSAAVRGGDQT